MFQTYSNCVPIIIYLSPTWRCVDIASAPGACYSCLMETIFLWAHGGLWMAWTTVYHSTRWTRFSSKSDRHVFQILQLKRTSLGCGSSLVFVSRSFCRIPKTLCGKPRILEGISEHQWHNLREVVQTKVSHDDGYILWILYVNDDGLVKFISKRPFAMKIWSAWLKTVVALSLGVCMQQFGLLPRCLKFLMHEFCNTKPSIHLRFGGGTTCLNMTWKTTFSTWYDQTCKEVPPWIWSMMINEFSDLQGINLPRIQFLKSERLPGLAAHRTNGFF